MPQLNEVKFSYQIGIKGNTRYIYAACPVCNQPRWTQAIKDNGVWVQRSKQCRECSGRASANKSIVPVVGFFIGNGYYYIKLEPDNLYFTMTNVNGYVKRSRLVVAQSLGRCLTEDEIVHHIDEDKLNDVIENLQLVTASEHAKLHPREYPEPKSKQKLHKCVDCGKERLVTTDKDGNPKAQRCCKCANLLKIKERGHSLNWKGGVTKDIKEYQRKYREDHKKGLS